MTVNKSHSFVWLRLSRFITRPTGDQILKAGFILTAGSLFASLFNYLFTLVIGRLLGPTLFGEVVAIFSLAAIIGVPAGALSMFMTRQSASLLAANKLSELRRVINLISRYSLLLGLSLLAIYFLFMPYLGGFLGVPLLTLTIFGLIIPASLLLSVGSGVLLGIQDFLSFSVSGLIGASSKLILAVLLVWLGLAVNGVIGALVLATLASYWYNKFRLAKKLPHTAGNFPRSADQAPDFKSVWPSFSLAFWALLLLALIGNLDIILAKHYLPAYWAGQYAGLSIAGKIILYGVGSFVIVMFPLVSAAHSAGDGGEQKHLLQSLRIISLLSFVAIAVFAAAPKLVVMILFGPKYLSIAPYLAVSGLAMYFVSLATVLSNYFVAIHDRRFIPPLSLALIAQFFLIAIYHQTIASIIWAEVFSMFLAALLLSFTYLYTNRQKAWKAASQN